MYISPLIVYYLSEKKLFFDCSNSIHIYLNFMHIRIPQYFRLSTMISKPILHLELIMTYQTLIYINNFYCKFVFDSSEKS